MGGFELEWSDTPIMAEVMMEPTPSDEEVVAIMAAVEALWPRPVTLVEEQRSRDDVWRFSGRWWARPVAARRDRPFY